MAWPKEIAGGNYVTLWWAAFAHAQREAGGKVVLVDDPSIVTQLGTAYVPEVTNAQAIGLVTMWDRAAARADLPDDAWSPWRRYALRLQQWALGWREWGDRFVMTPAQANASYAGPIGLLWMASYQLAVALDKAKTVVRPLPLDVTYASYEAGAREAWRLMVDSDARGTRCESCLPPAFETDPSCADSSCAESTTAPAKPAPKPEPESGSGWLLLLAIAVAFAASRR